MDVPLQPLLEPYPVRGAADDLDLALEQNVFFVAPPLPEVEGDDGPEPHADALAALRAAGREGHLELAAEGKVVARRGLTLGQRRLWRGQVHDPPVGHDELELDLRVRARRGHQRPAQRRVHLALAPGEEAELRHGGN